MAPTSALLTAALAASAGWACYKHQQAKYWEGKAMDRLRPTSNDIGSGPFVRDNIVKAGNAEVRPGRVQAGNAVVEPGRVKAGNAEVRR